MPDMLRPWSSSAAWRSAAFNPSDRRTFRTASRTIHIDGAHRRRPRAERRSIVGIVGIDGIDGAVRRPGAVSTIIIVGVPWPHRRSRRSRRFWSRCPQMDADPPTMAPVRKRHLNPHGSQEGVVAPQLRREVIRKLRPVARTADVVAHNASQSFVEPLGCTLPAVSRFLQIEQRPEGRRYRRGLESRLYRSRAIG